MTPEPMSDVRLAQIREDDAAACLDSLVETYLHRRYLLDEVDRLRAAVDLHQISDFRISPRTPHHVCVECLLDWPCDTARAAGRG